MHVESEVLRGHPGVDDQQADLHSGSLGKGMGWQYLLGSQQQIRTVQARGVEETVLEQSEERDKQW